MWQAVYYQTFERCKKFSIKTWKIPPWELQERMIVVKGCDETENVSCQWRGAGRIAGGEFVFAPTRQSVEWEPGESGRVKPCSTGAQSIVRPDSSACDPIRVLPTG